MKFKILWPQASYFLLIELIRNIFLSFAIDKILTKIHKEKDERFRDLIIQFFWKRVFLMNFPRKIST